MFVAALASTIVTTGLPAITGDLGGMDKVSWVVAAHLLANAATTPLWGKLSDLYGRKPLLLTAIGAFTVGTALCGLSQNIGQLIAFRAVQGLGVGGMITMSQAVIGDLIPPIERGRYQGWIGGTFAGATALGPLLGGVLTDSAGWRWCFWICLPFTAVAFLVIQRNLTLEARRSKVTVDYFGATLLTCGVSALLLLVSLGGKEFAWASGPAYTLGFSGIAIIIVMIWWEGRATDPILPHRLFRDRTFCALTASAFLMGSAMYASFVFLPQFLQLGRGYSATEAGLLVLPFIAGNFTGSMVSGRLITRTGRIRLFPVIGMGLSILASALFAWLVLNASVFVMWPVMILAGLGIGFTSQVLILAAQAGAEKRDMGVATSSITFFRTLGGTVSTAVFGVIITRRFEATVPGEVASRHVPQGDLPAGGLKSALSDPEKINAYVPELREAVHAAYSHGMSWVYLAVVPCVLLGLVAALLMRDQRLPTTRGT